MAYKTYDNHVANFPSIPSLSTPPPSLPIQLSGFLSGDTVQVEGDTGELKFSVQFNVCRKEHCPTEPFNFPGSNVPEIEICNDSIQSSASSSYLTPTSIHENQEDNLDTDAVGEESWPRNEIMTRLKTGALSPIDYSPARNYGVLKFGFSSGKKKKAGKARGKADYVFDKMLKRRSFPLRPCSSYAFFVMANWGVAKSTSFKETSKRLSKRWCKLTDEMKKEYENMALKDSARYKRQCALLRNDIEEVRADFE